MSKRTEAIKDMATGIIRGDMLMLEIKQKESVIAAPDGVVPEAMFEYATVIVVGDSIKDIAVGDIIISIAKRAPLTEFKVAKNTYYLIQRHNIELAFKKEDIDFEAFK